MNADWIQLETPDSPSPRANTAITYDEVLRNVVLFGGFSASHGGHSDTWKFDGANWTEVHPIQRPTERATNNLRWCPCSEQLVLVTGVKFSPTGGHHPITGQRVWSEHNLGDTWIFDGENWQELRQSQYPNYVHQASATDFQSGRVIVFGGIVAGPKTVIGVFVPRDRRESPLVDDTWIFDGGVWRQLHLVTRPTHRQFAAMSSHPGERGVLLFGGHGGEGKPHLLDDTWIFDGENWQELHPSTSPSPRSKAVMTHDRLSGTVILFGGHGGEGKPHLLGDTWIFDGENWQELHPSTSPSPREEACMTYDSMNGQVVLFGGRGDSEYLGDTWVLVLDE
ncbi:MAG: kelch repeat-containing protein [Ferrimicrobium sp.]